MKKILAIAGAAVVMHSPGHAANTAGTDGSERQLEEVIVTAQRTQESQQDVPVAMTVMDADTLQREQINNAQDLQGRIPSLTVGGNGQQRNTELTTIRGQGAAFGASSGVVMYYGEVPLPADFPFNGQGGPGKFFDISNMLVLKGPQGTLFGRNTTGGAIVIEPHQPDDDFGASLAAEAGNYNARKYEAIINVPIVEEKLLMRAGFQSVERDGFTREINSGKDLDNKNYWTARLGLTWRPTDNIENYLNTYYTHSDDNGTGVIIEGVNPLLGPANGPAVVAEQRARGIRKNANSLSPSDEIKTGGAIDQLNIEISDDLELRNILSYSRFTHSFFWDADGSILEMQDVYLEDGYKTYDISQKTEEIQLKGTALDENLEYVVGAYYQRVDPEGRQGWGIRAFGLVLPTQEFSTKQESYAPYAQGSYSFESLDGLTLTIGMRNTVDKIEGNSVIGIGYHSANLRSEAFTYTVGLDYKFDDTLLYGKISRGYKAGGFSATAPSPDLYTFEPEHVLNYEVGQKSDFSIGSMPARVNTSIYFTEFDDMQRGGIDRGANGFGAAIYTAGGAELFGVEIDATIEPTADLRVSLNYAYTDARYTNFSFNNTAFTPQLDCTGQQIQPGAEMNIDCAPVQYTPEHQASASVSYNLPFPAEIGQVSTSITYAWTDDIYSSANSVPEAEPGGWIDSVGLLNASVSWWSIFQSNFDVMVFGTNLTDEEYRVSNSNVWNLAYYRSSIYGEPRMYGARISYSFN